MDLILDAAIANLNLDSTQTLAALAIAMFVFRAIGNYISDDAVGFWGFVRKASKFLGGYVANRVTQGVNVDDVASASLRIAQVAKDAKAN